jgi:hypothetical protein
MVADKKWMIGKKREGVKGRIVELVANSAFARKRYLQVHLGRGAQPQVSRSGSR